MNITSVNRFVRFVRLPVLLLALCSLAFFSGCATSLINRHYQVQRKSAIKVSADAKGDGSATIWGGLDVLDIKDVAAHPLAHIGGVAVDVTTIYGLYTFAEKQGWIGDESNHKAKAETPVQPDPANVGNINAGGNVVIDWSASQTGSGYPVISDINAGGDVNINVSEPTGTP